MSINKKIDIELVKVIEDAKQTSSSSIEALEKVMKFKKEHRNLKGFHCSVYPNAENKISSNEDIAHDILVMELARANGDIKDITDTCAF